jgi:hypothetical protein
VPLAAGGAGVIPALPAVTNLTGHLGGNMVHLGVHAAMGQTLFILGMDALDASSPGNAIVEAPEIRIRTCLLLAKAWAKVCPFGLRPVAGICRQRSGSAIPATPPLKQGSARTWYSSASRREFAFRGLAGGLELWVVGWRLFSYTSPPDVSF